MTSERLSSERSIVCRSGSRTSRPAGRRRSTATSRSKRPDSPTRPSSNAANPSRDSATVEGFGREWDAFDQSGVGDAELAQIFDSYFSVFPWDALPPSPRGIDVGCGSGRWAALVASRLGNGGGRGGGASREDALLVALDASPLALRVARRRIAGATTDARCTLVQGAAGELPFPDGAFDFGYSLGVLHHTPDPAVTLADCVAKLRPGAPFLVYLYYALDNRPAWFRALWKITDAGRRGVSRLPFPAKKALTTGIAALVYWPLARAARLAEGRHVDVDGDGVGPVHRIASRNVDHWPLALYRHRSFYVMRNDALDRFGTRLEHRFTREQVVQLMEAAGLCDIEVSPTAPYWCAVGYRRDLTPGTDPASDS